MLVARGEDAEVLALEEVLELELAVPELKSGLL